jgi:thiol-disulfide isomerase/thioredoxin
MSELRPRSLRQRLVALLGVGAIVGFALAMLWIGGLFKSPTGEAATLVDTPPVSGASSADIGSLAGQVAPDFEITDFDGHRHRLSEYRGKVVYLNFWATWCVPCKAELADIYQLQQQYGDRLIVIEINKAESVDKASAFFKGLGRLDGGTGVSFTVNGIDPAATLYGRYHTLPIDTLPISVFIDAQGVVTQQYNGQMSATQMHDAVEQALGSSK